MTAPASKTSTCCTLPRVPTPRTTAAEALIANPKGSTADGAYFKVVASASGSFSVTNSRTSQTKEYARK